MLRKIFLVLQKGSPKGVVTLLKDSLVSARGAHMGWGGIFERAVSISALQIIKVGVIAVVVFSELCIRNP